MKQLNEEFILQLGRVLAPAEDRKYSINPKTKNYLLDNKYYIFLAQTKGEYVMLTPSQLTKDIDKNKSEDELSDKEKKLIEREKRDNQIYDILNKHGFIKLTNVEPPVFARNIGNAIAPKKDNPNPMPGLIEDLVDTLREIRQFEDTPRIYPFGTTDDQKNQIRDDEARDQITKLLNLVKHFRDSKTVNLPSLLSKRYQDKNKGKAPSNAKVQELVDDFRKKTEPSIPSNGYKIDANGNYVPLVQNQSVNDYKNKDIEKFLVHNLNNISERFSKIRGQLEKELVEALKDGGYKKYISDILQYRGVLKVDDIKGHDLSFLNMLLVKQQFPDAKLVMTAKQWMKYGRIVNDDATPIYLRRPKNKQYTNKEKLSDNVKDFYESYGLNVGQPLTPHLQAELEIVKANDQDLFGDDQHFYTYSVYDYSQTQKAPNVEKAEIDDDSFELRNTNNDKVEMIGKPLYLITALVSFLNARGVKIKFNQKIKLKNTLAFERGGNITMGDKFLLPNIDTFCTIVHETAHAMMHDNTFSKNNPNYEKLYNPDKMETAKNIKDSHEQQAELTAWAVCKNYGYDMLSSLPYLQGYHLTPKNAPSVLSTVSNTADAICKGINQYKTAARQKPEVVEKLLNSFGITSQNPSQRPAVVTIGKESSKPKKTAKKAKNTNESLLRESNLLTVDGLAKALGITDILNRARELGYDENYKPTHEEEMIENNKEQFYENYKRFFGKRVDL